MLSDIKKKQMDEKISINDEQIEKYINKVLEFKEKDKIDRKLY